MVLPWGLIDWDIWSINVCCMLNEWLQRRENSALSLAKDLSSVGKMGKRREERMVPINQQFLCSAAKGHVCPFRKNKSRLRSSKVMWPNTDLMLNWFNWAALSPAPMTAQGCPVASWVTPTADTAPCWRVGCTYAGGHQSPPWCRVSVPLPTSHFSHSPLPWGQDWKLPFLEPRLRFISSFLIISTQPSEEKEKWEAWLSLSPCSMTWRI